LAKQWKSRVAIDPKKIPSQSSLELRQPRRIKELQAMFEAGQIHQSFCTTAPELTLKSLTTDKIGFRRI
jgi:hypothetical protein